MSRLEAGVRPRRDGDLEGASRKLDLSEAATGGSAVQGLLPVGISPPRSPITSPFTDQEAGQTAALWNQQQGVVPVAAPAQAAPGPCDGKAKQAASGASAGNSGRSSNSARDRNCGTAALRRGHDHRQSGYSSVPITLCRPGEPEPSAVLVLDFDLTISSTHVWYTLGRSGTGRIEAARVPELSTELLYGREDRRDLLGALFTDLRAAGVLMLVLTNNYQAVVESCLRRTDYLRHFTAVIGRERPGTKGQIVVDLRSQNRRCTGPWVFVDDDVHNVRSVEIANQGKVHCLHVDGESGMMDRHMSALRRLLIPDPPPPLKPPSPIVADEVDGGPPGDAALPPQRDGGGHAEC
eukprot:Hpha_TRINITY_DN14713_c0_g3::TRINITY_DN14713_c0_g3_i1::g.103084::m.103084